MHKSISIGVACLLALFLAPSAGAQTTSPYIDPWLEGIGNGIASGGDVARVPVTRPPVRVRGTHQALHDFLLGVLRHIGTDAIESLRPPVEIIPPS